MGDRRIQRLDDNSNVSRDDADDGDQPIGCNAKGRNEIRNEADPFH